ncbi:hypothetical protein JCM11251_004275 [Rhodosporidiobolus azoricus]
MSSLRAGGARAAVLDPYPGFERTALPSLAHLASLHSYQLALVPFHSEASPSQIAEAKRLFQQRRLAAVSRREELGLPEKHAELRQLQRAKDWLEGKVPGSKKMKDGGVQTVERLFTLAEVKERISNVSKHAVERAVSEQRDKFAIEISRAVEMAVEEEKARSVERTKEACDLTIKLYKEEAWRRVSEMAERRRAAQQTTPLPPPEPSSSPAMTPSPHLPSPPIDEEAPPGPVFHLDRPDRGKPPVELLKLLFIVRVDDLPSIVTPQLLLQFMFRRQGKRFPRPLGISKTASGAIMVGFRSRAAAETAVEQLDDEPLPLVKRTMSANVVGAGAHIFRWHHLSDELEREWRAHERLPDAEWVEKIPGPTKGVKVSKGYHAEWNRIQRTQQSASAEAQAEEILRVQLQARNEIARRRQARERAGSEEQVADVLGRPQSRPAPHNGSGSSFASSSHDFSLPSSSAVRPLPGLTAPSTGRQSALQFGSQPSTSSFTPAAFPPARPAAFIRSTTPVGHALVEDAPSSDARPVQSSGSLDSGVRRPGTSSSSWQGTTRVHPDRPAQGVSLSNLSEGSSAGPRPPPHPTAFSSNGLWPRNNPPAATESAAQPTPGMAPSAPSRRVPPPPPPPLHAYTSHFGASRLPFSLPSSSAPTPSTAPSGAPSARTWNQREQQEEPTQDPRKRARFA